MLNVIDDEHPEFRLETGGEWNCDRERASLSDAHAGRDNRSAVSVNEFSDDSKAQTEPPIRAARSSIGLTKPVKDVRQEFGADALSIINDLDLRL